MHLTPIYGVTLDIFMQSMLLANGWMLDVVGAFALLSFGIFACKHTV